MSFRAVAALLVASAFAISTATANDCLWLYQANEGITASHTLTEQWSSCNGQISVATTGTQLSGFAFNDPHVPTFTYTPPYGSASATALNQTITVRCNVFTNICDTATVYLVVKASSATLPPTTTTTTAAPTTATPTTVAPTLAPGVTAAPGSSTTPAPTSTTAAPTPAPTTPVPTPAVPVVCTQPSTVTTTVATPTPIAILKYVTNCASPTVALVNSSSLFSVVNASSLAFDAPGTNYAEGLYTATVDVFCGDALVCILTQYVVAAASPSITTPAPTTAAPSTLTRCESVYGFDEPLSTLVSISLVGIAGATVCPTGSAAASYVATSLPASNPLNFSLNNATGTFVYLTPNVMSVDVFTFQLVCGGVPYCQANVYVVSSSTYETAAPTGSPAPTTAAPVTPTPPATFPTCSGNFSWVLYREASGVFPTQSVNFFNKATGGICSQWGSVVLVSSTTYGTVNVTSSSTGLVSYTLPSTDNGTIEHGWDAFSAILTCVPTAASTYQCAASAQVLVLPSPSGPTPAPTPEPTQAPITYTISESLTCRGTCDEDAWKSIDNYTQGFDVTTDMYGTYKQITPRKDGRGLDEVDYYIGAEDSVMIVAYAKIGNMAARFPTFAPISASSYLTSASVAGADVAFEPTCLDRQGQFGIAHALWTWTNMSSLEGYASNWYASGNADYYQKFGGKHVECNAFRNDACQYAPLLNPSNASGIHWKLYVDGCDVTWYADVPLATIKSLKVGSSNAAVFSTNPSDDVFTGTMYSEVIKPASWVRPSAGTLQLSRAYPVRIVLRPLLNVSAVTVSYTTPTTTAPPTTTTTTAAPSTSTSTPTTTATTSTASTATTIAPTATANPATAADLATKTSAASASSTASASPLSTVSAAPNTAASANPTTSTTVAPNSTSSPAVNATTQAPNSTTASPTVSANFSGLADFTVDVVYARANDSVTGERLFKFNVFMYPNTAVATVFENLYVTKVRLGNVSLSVPTLQSCPQCSGTAAQCYGLGSNFTDSCGKSALVTFAATAAASASCSNASVFPAVAGVSNVQTCPQTLFNISFTGRVNGAGSAASVADMEGVVSVLVDFSNGQTVALTVGQHDYISQASPTIVKTSFCRSTPYAPVVDPVGVSTPVSIYTATYNANATAAANQIIDLRNATIPTTTSFNATNSGSMCAVLNENTFGPQDWVYITITELQQENVSLEYLILAVDAKEVVPNPVDREFLFVLEGSLPMTHNSYYSVLDWKSYASFINFRSSSEVAGAIAFVPGTLLRAGSSPRVEFVLQASIKTPNGTSTIRFIIPVSKSITAALRNEGVGTSTQTYAPSTSTTSSSNILLILMLLLALIVVVVGSIMFDPDTRTLFATQLGALCCIKVAPSDKEAPELRPAVHDARIESYVTASPKDLAGKKKEAAARPSSPPRKALTPAAAAAQAAKRGDVKSPTSTTKKAATPAAPPAQSAPAAPTAVPPLPRTPSPQNEQRRVMHDE